MSCKYRQVILHFGGDKTGSTSIQSAFDASRQFLLESGLVAYPPGRWHAQLGSCFCDHPERYIFNLQSGIIDPERLSILDKQYLDQINDWISESPVCDSLVFSYEGYLDLDEPALRRFKNYCEALASTVIVVLYVRPPLSYAISAMSQRVKMGLKAWATNDTPVTPHKLFLQRIVSVFGKANILLRPFIPESLVNSDVVGDFLNALQVPDNVANKVTSQQLRTNKGLTTSGVCFGEMLIDGFKARELTYSGGQFSERFGQYLEFIPGSNLALTEEQARYVLFESRQHSEYLEEEFGIVFQEDFYKYIGSERGIAAPDIALMQSLADVLVNIVARTRTVRNDVSVAEFVLIRCDLNSPKTVERGQFLCFELEFSLALDIAELEIGIHIFDEDGNWAYGTNTTLLGRPLINVGKGTHRMSYYLVADLPGKQYTAGFAFTERRVEGNRDLAWYANLLTFWVTVPRLTPSEGYASLPVEFDYHATSNRPVELMNDASGTLDLDAALGDFVTGETFELQIRLDNASTQSWVSTRFHPINLAYHWYDQSGALVSFEGVRTPLSVREVRQGQSVSARMRVTMPTMPGRFRLMLTLVQEQRCWFEQQGFTPATVDIDVVNPGTLQRFPAADVRIMSTVGLRDGSTLVSTGREGFLLVGTAMRLPAGHYIARLDGRCVSAGTGAWVEVEYGKGSNVLSRQELGISTTTGVLTELNFELPIAVVDLNVRVWISAEARLRLDVLTIEPDTTYLNMPHLTDDVRVTANQTLITTECESATPSVISGPELDMHGRKAKRGTKRS